MIGLMALVVFVLVGGASHHVMTERLGMPPGTSAILALVIGAVVPMLVVKLARWVAR